MKTNVAFLIPTFNEEKNLSYALESCSFADQVFVLDSGSNDKTRQIAERSGAVFEYHAWEGFARQKNWGLSNLPIRTDWIFILDADEAITPSLRDELIAIASGRVTATTAGYYVNRYFVWEGREIRHCGYYPSWNLRFFRRGKARYEERDVHEHMVVDGTVGYLKNDMRHEDRRGRDYLWQKHLKYAELEAREMIKVVSSHSTAGLKPSIFGNSLERRRAVKERIWPHLPGRWFWRFFYMYVMKRGFLDGSPGLDMCLFMARYEMVIEIKYRQFKDGLALE
jgi:glycosyltransferase involved in cell wall biosynthesis